MDPVVKRPFETSFPPTSFEDWRRAVESGGRPIAALTTKTIDGIEVPPLFASGDAATPRRPRFARTSGTWTPRPRYRQKTVSRVLARMAAAETRGARASWLLVDRPGTPGVRLDSGAALDELLSGLDLTRHDLLLDAGARGEAVARAVEERVSDPSTLHGSFGLDPLAPSAAVAAWCAERAPAMRSHLVSTRADHDAGATPVQELAVALATGVAGLRALTDAGLSVDDAAAQLLFQFAVGPDVFLETAKLRAARIAWGLVLAASGASTGARTMAMHVTTSSRTRTRRAPYVNLVRGTVEAAAAVFGGADSLTVLPFDDAIGDSDDPAERLAWNTNVILSEESFLSCVADPAAGSGYVEAMTEAFTTRAWASFQDIESKGGMEAVRRSGAWDEAVRESAEALDLNLARRRPRLVGITDFVQLAEVAVVREGGDAARGHVRRLSRPFESLRDAVDRLAPRPRVFIAALGAVEDHKPRSRFAAQLFAVAGIDTTGGEGPGAREAIPKAFEESGSKVAVVCATDATRAVEEAPLVEALRVAGAERVYVAGRPLPDGHAAPDVVHVYEGCDVLAALTDLVRFFEEGP